MKQIPLLSLALILAACGDNGTVLGSQTNGGAGGSTGSGGASSGLGGAANPGDAGSSQGIAGGSGGAPSGAGAGASGTGGSGAGGEAGTASSAGAAGSAGAMNDECGGCTPPEQICILQGGGPGPSRFLCAEQVPCGAAGACACIVNQGPCMFQTDDGGVSGICVCDNGLE